ncbi:hypothetical protein CKR_1778 [Clostridium kluyveri NBRC 12016]|uniref:Uncharacterized protein n=1 Tax=Clostridium kluyveri (strain NBRC 12016) TaxID=583346 RepID=B9E2V4_CLOK1|nr:hypothetical protein CKR_1778 [Clostridium kluyveri NBRC 12016]
MVIIISYNIFTLYSTIINILIYILTLILIKCTKYLNKKSETPLNSYISLTNMKLNTRCFKVTYMYVLYYYIYENNSTRNTILNQNNHGIIHKNRQININYNLPI